MESCRSRPALTADFAVLSVVQHQPVVSSEASGIQLHENVVLRYSFMLAF